MTIGTILRAALLSGVVISAAPAQEPKRTPPELPAIPKASDPDAAISPGVISTAVVKVVSADPPANGSAKFPKMLADAREAHAKARDYVGHFVRQERVDGVLQPEVSGEIRVRAQPFSIDLKVLAPKAAAGWETVYVAGKRDEKIRFKQAGIAGLSGFTTMKMDASKAMAGTRHPISEVGMMAVLNQAEKLVNTEKKLQNPVQITVSNYTFNDRPCQRYDIYADRPHPTRYCHHIALFVDNATKLPVRYEAYNEPKSGETAPELLEMISFVNLKLGVGLGDSAFDK